MNGRLFTTGITGVISCYDASTGKRFWQMNPWEDLKVPRPGFGVCASPVVVDGKLIVAVGVGVVHQIAVSNECSIVMPLPTWCPPCVPITEGVVDHGRKLK